MLRCKGYLTVPLRIQSGVVPVGRGTPKRHQPRRTSRSTRSTIAGSSASMRACRCATASASAARISCSTSACSLAASTEASADATTGALSSAGWKGRMLASSRAWPAGQPRRRLVSRGWRYVDRRHRGGRHRDGRHRDGRGRRRIRGDLGQHGKGVVVADRRGGLPWRRHGRRRVVMRRFDPLGEGRDAGVVGMRGMGTPEGENARPRAAAQASGWRLRSWLCGAWPAFW